MCSLSLPPLITGTSQCSPRTRLLRAHPLKSALMLRMRRPFSKQICRRQLKSITSQTAPPKWHVVHQPSPCSRLQNVQHSATFDLTFLCMSDVMRLKANTCFFFFTCIHMEKYCMCCSNAPSRITIHAVFCHVARVFIMLGGCLLNTVANTMYQIVSYLKRRKNTYMFIFVFDKFFPMSNQA